MSQQDEQPDRPRIVVITPDGMGVATGGRIGEDDAAGEGGAGGADATGRRAEGRGGDDRRGRDGQASDEPERTDNPADLVEQPAKVMRIGSMIKNLLDEVRSSPLDEAGRLRLAEIHKRSIHELKDGLAPELVAELDRIALPFGEGAPSDAELRIAQAQLVGWLEGLFHGIQTALVAQQMAAQQQLAGMRRALPPGQSEGPGQPGMPPGMVSGPGSVSGETGSVGPTGQYL